MGTGPCTKLGGVLESSLNPAESCAPSARAFPWLTLEIQNSPSADADLRATAKVGRAYGAAQPGTVQDIPAWVKCVHLFSHGLPYLEPMHHPLPQLLEPVYNHCTWNLHESCALGSLLSQPVHTSNSSYHVPPAPLHSLPRVPALLVKPLLMRISLTDYFFSLPVRISWGAVLKAGLIYHSY